MFINFLKLQNIISIPFCSPTISGIVLEKLPQNLHIRQKNCVLVFNLWMTWQILKHSSRKTLYKLGWGIQIPHNHHRYHNLLDLLHIYSWEYNNWQIILDELQDHNLMYQVWSNNSSTYAQSKIQSNVFLYYNYL